MIACREVGLGIYGIIYTYPEIMVRFLSIVVYVQTNLEENNGTNICRSFKINCQVLARNY